MKNIFPYLLLTRASLGYLGMDYFSEEFDEEKNCKELKVIKKMKKLKKENCALRTVGI